jgi:hypothetical protein
MHPAYSVILFTTASGAGYGLLAWLAFAGVLGVVPGRVVRFREGAMVAGGERLKVPHMGWSPVRQARPHPLWAGIAGWQWIVRQPPPACGYPLSHDSKWNRRASGRTSARAGFPHPENTQVPHGGPL